MVATLKILLKILFKIYTKCKISLFSSAKIIKNQLKSYAFSHKFRDKNLFCHLATAK